jgi:hypothetical protein
VTLEGDLGEQHRHTVRLQDFIARNNGVPIFESVRDEKPIERIAMVPRQTSNAQSRRSTHVGYAESGPSENLR